MGDHFTPLQAALLWVPWNDAARHVPGRRGLIGCCDDLPLWKHADEGHAPRGRRAEHVLVPSAPSARMALASLASRHAAAAVGARARNARPRPVPSPGERKTTPRR